jgi:outer membrane protein assembly factor BamB
MAKSTAVRFGVPAMVLLGLAMTLWQGTQFEIRPAADRTPFLLADPRPGIDDWPGARGPMQDNAIAGEFLAPPPESHGWPELWRARLDGVDHSGVCVWGERIFVTANDLRRGTLDLVCVQRSTGIIEWRTPLTTINAAAVPATKGEPTARRSPPLRSGFTSMTATPTCDGERVFVPVIADGELTLWAVSVTGRVAWKQVVGPANGRGLPRSSPTLSGALVIVACDQSGSALLPGRPASYLAGLHRQTGKIIYRIARPNGDSDGTPVVADVAGRSQLFLTGRQGVRSYDPASGRELWACRWKAARTEGAVAFDAEHVYAVSGELDGELLCIRADGEGDVTDSHIEWRERRAGQKLLTPLVTQAGLCVLTRDGVLTAINPETGKPLWQKRSLGSCSAPPFRVGTQGVCLITDDGHVALLNADRRGEVLWEAQLNRPVTAIPVISQGRLILSGPDALIALGGSATDTLVQQPAATGQAL